MKGHYLYFLLDQATQALSMFNTVEEALDEASFLYSFSVSDEFKKDVAQDVDRIGVYANSAYRLDRSSFKIGDKVTYSGINAFLMGIEWEVSEYNTFLNSKTVIVTSSRGETFDEESEFLLAKRYVEPSDSCCYHTNPGCTIVESSTFLGTKFWYCRTHKLEVK